MTTPRRVLTHGVLAVLSLLSAIAVCEACLRFFLPRYESAATTPYYAHETRVWAAVPNSSHVTRHPDSGAYVSTVYNSLGMRQSREFGTDALRNATNVAFFGDSFTENRHIGAAYSFTESLDFLLNLRERAAFNVLKFSVAAYGPGQQFIWYRQFEHRDELDHVVYVFCHNDLHDFHKQGLFSLDQSGELVPNVAHRTSFLMSLLSRLHLTYLAIDVAWRAKSGWTRLARAIPSALAQPSRPERRAPIVGGVQTSQEMLAHVEQRIVRWRQEGDALSGDAWDDAIATFQALLLHWKQEVEAHGGKFHVALLPYMRKEWVRELIPSAVDIVDLHGCFSRAIPNYSYDAVSFDHPGNDHWDDTGNMVAAHCLYRLLEEETGLPRLSDDALAEARYEYYRAIGGSDGWMPSAPWTKRPPTMRHDPAAIAAKYLALEREPGERPLQLVSKAEALANSGWIIYLVRDPAAQDSLVYLKMRCDEEDKASGFLLQVDAANPADLPLERQAFGYEDLDFDFEGDGVDSGIRLHWRGAVQLLPGTCVVTASLPAYEIAAVRTGQYSDSGEVRHAWMVEFAADELFPRNRAK